MPILFKNLTLGNESKLSLHLLNRFFLTPKTMEQSERISDKRLIEMDDRISSFLNGTMSEKQERQFLEDIKYDGELKSKAVATARMAKAMIAVGRKRDRQVLDAMLTVDDAHMESIVSETVNAGKGKDRRPVRQRRLMQIVDIVMAVAASVVLMLVMETSYMNYKAVEAVKTLGDEYARVFSADELLRGGENADVKRECRMLFDNVKTGKDLDATTARLAQLWDLSTMSIYNDYTIYAPEIGWNLAIAYLKEGEPENARIVLAKLMERTDEGSAMNERAKELMRQIERKSTPHF